MKQHITPEQLNELCKKGKKRLRKWYLEDWSPRGFDDIWYDGETIEEWVAITEEELPLNREKVLPVLNIGQLIEFLDDDNGVPLSLVLMDIAENMSFKKLTDALWEATKEKLEA